MTNFRVVSTFVLALTLAACSEESSVESEEPGGEAGKGGSGNKGGSSGKSGAGQGGQGGMAAGQGGANQAGTGAAGAGAGGVGAGQGGTGGGQASGAAGTGAGAAGVSAGGSAGQVGAGTGGAGSGGAGSGSGGAAAGGAGGAVAGSGGAAGGAGGCQPACTAPQVCSAAGSCIDPGTCLVDKDCGGGLICALDKKTCEPGSACGVTKLSAQIVPPNVLIVLDRSCSMKQNAGGKSKWEAAAGAITKLTTTFKDQIRFGMTMFPDTEGGDCGQNNSSLIDLGPNSYQTIQNRLSNAQNPNNKFYPDGPCVTNIDTAVDEASKVAALSDPARKSFVLLISDGGQAGCNAAGGNMGTQNLISAMATKGIGTFVVGFSDNVSESNLNKFAQLGGYPNPDPAIDYYKAESEASLAAALDVIAKQTLGCNFVLAQKPESDIFVFFDQTTQIPKDSTHADGWDYDAAQNQVTFFGPACASLQSGQVSKVDIVFGCPGSGTVEVPPGCVSKRGCNAENLCPPDPDDGPGLCQDGCCLYGKL